ncbi:ankyrin repeat-containing domain protein [Obelidium mucronatum]|nr:ankyrin repeat-containing domain protein [Obelidium mucronatum]
MSSPSIDELFRAVKSSNPEVVRSLISSNRDLTREKLKDPAAKFDPDIEIDAYKFLGAYVGSLTALHLALLKGNDSIARDIIDVSSKEDLDISFGGGNTALHLATLLGAKDIVKLLLERGASRQVRNTKGFAPVDVLDDSDMRKMFQ